MLLNGVPIITLLLFLSTASGDDGIKAGDRQFPYSAHIVVNYNNALNDLGEWDCSGAIISEKFVITAGLCVEGVSKFKIKLGARAIGSKTDDKFEYAYDHVTYTNPLYSITRDLALIRLNPRCIFTPEIQPVRIPVNATNVNNWLMVAGWNANKENQLERQWLPVRVVSDANCNVAYPTINLNTMMCAQGDEADGKCLSLCRSLGAPLVAENNTLIGISIGQISSPCEKGPQIFARVTWSRSWISAALEITAEPINE